MTSDKITDHHINECNEHIQVVRHHDGQTYVLAPPAGKLTRLFFQNGPVLEGGRGINGITNEALLAVVIDRLRHFQAGPFACAENAAAIMHIRDALLSLEMRTGRRIEAGVEGTHGVDAKAEGVAFAQTEPPPAHPPVSAQPKWPGQTSVPPLQPRNEDLAEHGPVFRSDTDVQERLTPIEEIADALGVPVEDAKVIEEEIAAVRSERKPSGKKGKR